MMVHHSFFVFRVEFSRSPATAFLHLFFILTRKEVMSVTINPTGNGLEMHKPLDKWISISLPFYSFQWFCFAIVSANVPAFHFVELTCPIFLWEIYIVFSSIDPRYRHSAKINRKDCFLLSYCSLFKLNLHPRTAFGSTGYKEIELYYVR
jgi:hypothetical protein